MTFADITRIMLSSMDFFELRRTAARYNVPYQGVRKQKLLKEVEKTIILKSNGGLGGEHTLAASSPMAAVSAKPQLGGEKKPLKATRIATFSARNRSTVVR